MIRTLTLMFVVPALLSVVVFGFINGQFFAAAFAASALIGLAVSQMQGPALTRSEEMKHATQWLIAGLAFGFGIGFALPMSGWLVGYLTGVSL